MLDALGIQMGRERELYASDLEYAAALLDTDLAEIQGILDAASQPARRRRPALGRSDDA